ncbi:MAG: energy-coupling factor ABC transporter ATP-binding protein [Peptococcaceae bacterium]|nr:energy-coupling factor ABC transporter ATP-binding protein [Peptococcaceae bacterium]
MIQLNQVNFVYHNARSDVGVHHINLHIPKGQVVLLCGSSGCGKTTLSRMINGLIPNFYEGTLSGEITVCGRDTKNSELYELTPFVGSVFQNPKSQFYTVQTDSEIVFACENIGMEKAQIYQRFEDIVDKLNLTPLLGKSLFALSGGQKQKIACASVATLFPQILVMDEPSSNLDIAAIHELAGIIKQWKDAGCTIVIAEHRLYWLMDIVDRVIYVKNGRIDQDISIQEFLAIPADTLASMGLRARTISFDKLSALPAKNTEMIDFKDFSFAYDKEKNLDILSLSIPCGSVVAVIGKNGAGKSTFGRCMCGLEKKARGTMTFCGRNLSWKARINTCYLVMQDVNHQLFTESVLDEILLSMEKSHDEAHAKKEKALQILASLNLDHYQDVHPMSLSGGQKQRVSVACALASNKQILVYDEPTSGLDYARMIDVAEAIKNMQAKGKTQFIITHDPELIKQCCDYLVLIEDGRIIASGWLQSALVDRMNDFFMA